MGQKQTGFTLVEIAIVLVIIGLLLGGVLKGQELITSARVRNLISQQEGIKTAFFGFQDRYRSFPGDYTAAVANIPNISTAACNAGVGNGNGRIEANTGNESVLAWEHLSKAGFITGNYTCAATESTATTPVNAYGAFVQLIYDGLYGTASGTTPSPARHNIKTGAQIPVELLSEMDRKVDDALPNTGSFQFSPYSSAATACSQGTTQTSQWNTAAGNPNCGGASLL